MIGIGLGGFMDGFQKGQKIRDDKEDRERRKVLEGRQDEEYNRLKSQRDAIDGINAEAKTTFDAKVAAGEAEPDAFDNFYTNYAVPKIRNTYLSQGNVEMADKFSKWAETDETRRGAKLFQSAIFKAQSGDSAGAMADVMELGKVKGYLDHGYEVTGQENIMVDGKLAGYRINMKTPDGKDVSQDIVPQDLPKLITRFGNPEAAWESQIAAQNDKAKREQDLATYRDKKAIDKEYGTGDTKARGDAIKSLRERMDGGLDGKGEKFDDLPSERQEELIAKEIELVTGQPGVAAGGGRSIPSRPDPQPVGRKVVMDKATGRPVEQPAAKSQSSSAPAAREAKPQQSAPATDPRDESEGDRAAAVLKAAEVALNKGEAPEKIAITLRNYGIPEDLWPPALLDRGGRSGVQIGLGE